VKKVRFILCIIIVCALVLTTSISALALENVTIESQLITSDQNSEVSNISWDDVYAGVADPREMYEPLDPDSVPEIIGYDVAYERFHVERLYEEETDLYSIVFLNANGTKTVYLYDYPVKYVDQTGEVKDITLDIQTNEEEFGSFVTENNSIQTSFSRNISDGIALQGENVSLQLIPLPTHSSQQGNSYTKAEAITINATADLNDDVVSYAYDENTTIEYSLTYTGFKEDIVVSEYTGQTTYDFKLFTNGLSLIEQNDSFYLINDNGQVCANIGDIIIFTADEQNNTFGSLSVQTIISKEEYVLTIHVDEEFLSDENTVYPIRIDPTIEINYDANGSGAIEDVTINSLRGSDGTSSALFVGKRETYGISRVLMRFPNLDLASIPTAANIESATVELRDILCEGEAMTVYCHAFTGNAWTETTAQWSSVNANSYSAAISSVSISYNNGVVLESAHRYAFDITSAVRGWKLGNYTQSKGLLFKASSSVENGSTYINKTFASYNRSSKKPSLSITYSSTQPSATLSEDAYYINNTEFGEYIRYNNSNLSVSSGLLDTLSTSIQWELDIIATENNTTYYIIRSKNDPTKCLSGSFYITIDTVIAATVAGGTYPNECQWTATIADHGGVWIRNRHTGKYLYITEDGTLSSTSSYGTYGTALYDSTVWRFAKTSWYGTSNSYTKTQLPEGYELDHMIVNVGSSDTPEYTETDNALWVSAADFSYTIVDGGAYVNLSGENIYANARVNAHIKAIHKVTGLECTFPISTCVYSVTHRVYYDHGFLERSGITSSEAREYIGHYNKFARGVYAWNVGVNIQFLTPVLYTSYADQCDNNYSNGGLDVQCTCYSAPTNTNADLRHKNNRKILSEFKSYLSSRYTVDETHTVSLWTGYKTWEYNSENDYVEIQNGALTSSRKYIMMLNKASGLDTEDEFENNSELHYTFIHELGHTMGLPDSYCFNNPTGNCTNSNCAFCDANSDFGQECVMAKLDYITGNFSTLKDPDNYSEWFCEHCIELMKSHLRKAI
jgi:hypothetical protein